jgi:UDP-2,3-diacylglucosamine pyrophosphatase LpxH
LHQQLFEEHREKGNLPFGGVLPIVVSQTPQDDASCPVIRTHHTTHVGDIHCGHGQPSRRKEGAMRLIAERAKDRGAVIFNHGDTLDTGANQKRMQKELQMILKVLQECGMSFKKCMLGNHDFEYLLKGVMEKLLGHRVEPSLITCTMNNLLLTHGHVSELALLPSILEAHRGSRDAIMQALSIKALQKPLEDMAVMYDLIGYGEKVLQRVGIHGFNEFWRNIFPIRKRVARMLVDAIEGNGLPTEHMNAMMHMLGSEHREMMLAELALATDCQGFVFGHTHDPVLTVLELRGNQVLGGNVGCFRRKGTPITWIEACRQKRGRETEIVMELFGYEARKGWKGDRDVLIDRRSVPAIQRRKTS